MRFAIVLSFIGVVAAIPTSLERAGVERRQLCLNQNESCWDTDEVCCPDLYCQIDTSTSTAVRNYSLMEGVRNVTYDIYL